MKVSGDSALFCFPYPFAACLSAFLCLTRRGLPVCTARTRKAADHISTAKIAMLTSHFASSAVMCPIPDNRVHHYRFSLSTPLVRFLFVPPSLLTKCGAACALDNPHTRSFS
jgi:hypothetical protein